MARQKRQDSETGMFHVTSRGAGRRNLFEDDADRSFYLSKLKKHSIRNDVTILAWCLMSNHIHLLLAGELPDLTTLMRAQNTTYAQYFNGKYGHIGPVFQGRFASVPINDESHLLDTVRYIHLNPQAAGLCRFDDYQWSSYREYVAQDRDSASSLCDTSLILEMIDDFVEFHEIKGLEIEMMDLIPVRRYFSDGEISEIACKLFGDSFADSIALMPKSQRDAALKRLYGYGASIRQLERLTGIGRGAIQYAVKE